MDPRVSEPRLDRGAYLAHMGDPPLKAVSPYIPVDFQSFSPGGTMFPSLQVKWEREVRQMKSRRLRLVNWVNSGPPDHHQGTCANESLRLRMWHQTFEIKSHTRLIVKGHVSHMDAPIRNIRRESKQMESASWPTIPPISRGLSRPNLISKSNGPHLLR